MRAVVCRVLGDASNLKVEDVAFPLRSNGEVKIKVEAAGVNFADTLIVQGKYQFRPSLPFSPGFEVAGRIIEGDGDYRPGDRVLAILTHGGYAEEVVAPVAAVYRLPDEVDAVTAASCPVAYGTSHLGLKHLAALKAGESVLIHGAAGGVGLTAVEIAKSLGATVIATASSAEKLRIAAIAGADHGIDSGAEDLRDQVKALTGGAGVDVVYDPVGGKLFEASVRCTAPGGRMLVVGFAGGEVQHIQANLLLVKNLSVIGYAWAAYQSIAPKMFRQSMEELILWLAQGKLQPLVSATYDLGDAVQALDDLLARRSTGKLVLTVGSVSH